MNMTGKKVIVVGAGKSGIASSNLLLGHGADVLLYDSNKELDIKSVSEKTKAHIKAGELSADALAGYELAVFSPGVPLDCPDALLIKDAGIGVIGEIELGYLFAKGRIAAITGTNGKTTTTALTGELLGQCVKDVRVVGNIGEPFTENIEDTTDETVIVAEISSFQLETTDTFAPKVSAILNITPDHLNRHHTMEAYIQAKERIAENSGVVVLNYEDEVLREFGEGIKDKSIVWFSSARTLANGYYTKDGIIKRCENGNETDIIDTEELNIIGVHNHENAMAAIAVAENMGADIESIRRGLRSFKAVAHRIEFAGEINGVKYYDDSKATNTDAAIKGIEAMPSSTYLIGGGYDKGSTYHDWIKSFDGKVKKLLLIGVTKEKIKNDAAECGFYDCEFFDSLKDAFEYAYEHAVPGEQVLLSPACASWDMFKSYEQRGDMFKEMVAEKAGK